MKWSRRQELREFAETGQLRDVATEGRLSQGACDLLVDIVMRYCDPPSRKRAKAANPPLTGATNEQSES